MPVNGSESRGVKGGDIEIFLCVEQSEQRRVVLNWVARNHANPGGRSAHVQLSARRVPRARITQTNPYAATITHAAPRAPC